MHRFARRLRLLPLLAGLALLALATPATAAPAGTTLLVSRPDGTALFTPPKDGDVNVGAPLAVSDDGRYAAFVSNAPGLDPAANPLAQNVYLRDTLTGTTTLVSRSDGANGVAADADAGVGIPNATGTRADTLGIAVQPFAASGDAPHGQPHVLVAFSTTATNLVDHVDHTIEHGGGQLMVWMRDVTAGTTYLVSRANGMTGDAGDADSFQPSIAASPGGPLVAFTSESNNLYTAWGQIPLIRQIYLREVGTGVTHVVSCPFELCGHNQPPRGVSEQPSLRFVAGTDGGGMCGAGQACAVVAFASVDPTMFPGYSPPPSALQVVGASAVQRSDGRLDEFGDFHVASYVNSSPPQLANADAVQPRLTGDGEGVAFLSGATNLAPNLYPGTLGVEAYFGWWRRPGLSNMSVGINPATSAYELPNADVTHLSVGGTFIRPRIGTVSSASNWGAPGPTRFAHAFAEDDQAAQALLDASADGTPGNRTSGETEISADGTTAVFYSNSTNLGAGSSTDFVRVYRRVFDPNAHRWGPPQLVSRPSGTGSFPQGDTVSDITGRAISADGRYVAFQTTERDISSASATGVRHVYVRDTVNGTTTLADRASGASGAPADVGSQLNAISDDGRRVMFTSAAANLCPGCDQGPYAYVRDLAASTTILVSRASGSGGEPVPVDPSGQSLSGDGNRAAFVTPLAIDAAAANGVPHLYVRDIAKDTTALADRDDGSRGRVADRSPLDASLNRDGSKVAWTTDALLAGAPFTPTPHLRVFVRDLNAGATVLASRADGAGGAVADGDSLHAAIDAAGDAVAFESTATNLGPVSHRSIWVRRLNAGQTLLVSRASGASGPPADDNAFKPSIDAVGDKVAFMSHASNLGALDGDEGTISGLEAYVRGLGTNVTALVSRANGVSGPLAAPAGTGDVSISANGGCAAFSSSGLDFTDPLASALYRAVRERVLTSNCGVVAGAVVDGGPPPAGLDAPVAPSAAPAAAAALSRLLASPARFFVGAHGGTRLSFALSRAATVTLAFDRLIPGRAHAASCLASARTGRRCTLVRHAGRLVVHAHAGVNRIRFSGRIGRRVLAPGRYRWTATPLHGRAHSARFTVLWAPLAVVAPPAG
jgi:hypothetical protein